MVYDTYLTKKLAGHFYLVCAYCERTVVSINGELKNHHPWCEHCISQEKQEEIDLLKLKVELLRYGRQNMYAVMCGWISDEGSGEDINSLRLFSSLEQAESYITQQEPLQFFNPSHDYCTLRKVSLIS